MGATTLLTFEEFERLPSEPGKMELLDGELIRLPPGKLKHTKIIHRLQKSLEPVAERAPASAGLGGVWIEAGYKMGEREEFRGALQSALLPELRLDPAQLFS